MQTNQVKPKKKQVDKERGFEAHIRQYESSGMTIKAYCRANQLNYSRFYYHFKRHNINPGITSIQPSILPLHIASLQEDKEIVSVLFAEVHGIKLFQAVSADYLLTLLNR
jgi:hypothetical protein